MTRNFYTVFSSLSSCFKSVTETLEEGRQSTALQASAQDSWGRHLS